VGALTSHWWWLLVGIPALLLIGMAVLVGRRWRRRRAAKRDKAGDSDESGYEAVTESVSQRSPDADDDVASSSLSDDYRPPRRTVRLPSQPVSEWMPPGRRNLVDELLEDEPESADESSGVADFDHDVDEDFDEDLDEDFDEEVEEDPDNVDTAPTGIPSAGEGRGGRHAAADADGDDADVTAAVPTPRIAAGQLAIHLPMDDPYQVPDGYPVKANASFGLYYMPDSALYEDTLAEIWFASEEIARANGFHKAG
jgi:uncharacterized protein with LGFP repeats